uniref:WAP domain-containing protein n=1 Tax=Neolamprologus brichardi TaxID=32507 RepID=A0A3Q4MBG2_NEOBR
MPQHTRHFAHNNCAKFCSDDRDCPFILKCCYNGCGHECMVPAIGEIRTK